MIELVTALSIATLATALFAFRFQARRRPRTLLAYFVFVFGLEWVAQRMFLPPNAFGLEVAAVCGGITVLFLIAIALQRRLEESSRREP